LDRAKLEANGSNRIGTGNFLPSITEAATTDDAMQNDLLQFGNESDQPLTLVKSTSQNSTDGPNPDSHFNEQRKTISEVLQDIYDKDIH
jgi:hypothetical protein